MFQLLQPSQSSEAPVQVTKGIIYQHPKQAKYFICRQLSISFEHHKVEDNLFIWFSTMQSFGVTALLLVSQRSIMKVFFCANALFNLLLIVKLKCQKKNKCNFLLLGNTVLMFHIFSLYLHLNKLCMWEADDEQQFGNTSPSAICRSSQIQS